MKEQDESYLDSLLDAFARETPLERASESGGRHRKKKKSQAEVRRETMGKRREQEDNPDRHADDALTLDPFESMEEPDLTPEFSGIPDEMAGDALEPDFSPEEFKDFELEDTELDEELPDFSFDDLDLKELNPASAPDVSGKAEGNKNTGASPTARSGQAEAADIKASLTEPAQSPAAEEEDIARILNQIEEANEPGDLAGIAEETSSEDSGFLEEEPSGETGEIGWTDSLFDMNTAEENGQAGEDKMADHGEIGGMDGIGLPDETGGMDGIGLPDETGVTDGIGMPDEIGVSDGIGMPDEIGVPDGIGMPDEIGVSDEIGVPDGIGMPDEIGVSDEIGMPDEIGVSDEIGMPDEIGVSDEIGVPDEIDGIGGIGIPDEAGVPDGVGLPGEIGATDEIGIPDVDLFDLLGSPEEEPHSGGSEAEPGPLPSGGAVQAEEEPEENRTGRKRSRKKKEKDARTQEETGAGFSMKALFRKLFGNIPVEGEAEAGLLPEDAETEEERKEAKKAEKAKAKEEKKAAKEEAKKAKQAAAKAKAEEKKAEKENSKKEKELKEIKEVAPETETGRINRVGAVIVFSFFVIIAAVILLGSNASFYELSVQGAEKEFAMRHYNEAYYKIRGIEVKPADMELHDRIMTVMYVNKQLNSYNNFYLMEDYPKALDSLLKGLERYEKYLALAQELGIEGDLDYVRNQILAELDRVYGLEERDAMNLSRMENTTDYSSRIYDAASKVRKEEKVEEEEYVP